MPARRSVRGTSPTAAQRGGAPTVTAVADVDTKTGSDQSPVVPPPAPTRLSVNLSEDTAEALQGLVARRRTTLTDGVRRAIAVWKFVEDEVAAGNRLAVIDKNGNVREVVLVA